MDILEINAKERYVRVEPMVTIGRLMEALVERGWMVPIVPEIGEDFFLKKKTNRNLLRGTLHFGLFFQATLRSAVL